VDGAFNSGGYNLIATTDHSTGFPTAGDITGTDASPVNPFFLFPPANHGGPTDTITFFGPSPAIHHANAATSEERDQRGYIRDFAPDIGAYETNGSLLKLYSFVPDVNLLILNIEVVEGHVYRIERKLNITDANWNMISGDPDFIARDDDIEGFIDSGSSGLGKAFFHAVVVQ
jgi:hypothetical protein